MGDFGIETLSDECSRKKANEFVEWLEPKSKLAEKELGNDESVDFDDVEVDEVLTEQDKQKIEEAI